MNEAWDWRKQWKPHNRAGTPLIEVFRLSVACKSGRHFVSVASDGFMIAHHGDGRVDRGDDCGSDLIPVPPPTPKLRPWEQGEFPPHHWFRKKGQGARRPIQTFNPTAARAPAEINGVWWTFHELLEKFEHAPEATTPDEEWRPCGVVAESEAGRG